MSASTSAAATSSVSTPIHPRPQVRAVASQIKKVCGEWLECEIWDRGDAFAINRSFLDSLLRAAQRYHYGIFVATKDDRTVKKGASIIEPRG